MRNIPAIATTRTIPMLNRIYGRTIFDSVAVPVAAAVLCGKIRTQVNVQTKRCTHLLGGGAGVTENVLDVPMIEPFLTTPPLLSSEILAIMTQPSLLATSAARLRRQIAHTLQATGAS